MPATYVSAPELVVSPPVRLASIVNAFISVIDAELPVTSSVPVKSFPAFVAEMELPVRIELLPITAPLYVCAPVVVTDVSRLAVLLVIVRLVSAAVPPTIPRSTSPPAAVIAKVCPPSTAPSVTSLPASVPVSTIALAPASVTSPAVTPWPAVFTVKVPFSVRWVTAP